MIDISDCPVVLIEEELWRCPDCRWKYKGPVKPRRNCPKSDLRPKPGTELKKLLHRFGLDKKHSCRCEARLAEMNNQGPEWCRASMDVIVGWLQQEAIQRQLPFSRPAAVILVRVAVWRSEKIAKAKQQGAKRANKAMVVRGHNRSQ